MNYKSVGLIAFSQLTQIASAFVLVKALTITLSPEVFSQYNLALSLAFFIGLFPFTSFDQAIFREISEHKDSFDRFLKSVILIYVVLSLISFCIFTGIINIFLSKEIQDIIFAIFTYAYFTIFKNTLVGMENYKLNYKASSFLRIFDNSIRLSVTIAVYYLAIHSLKIILLLLSLPAMLIVFFILARNSRVFKLHSSMLELFNMIKMILPFSSPLIVWAIFGFFQNMSYIWFLDFYGFKVESGIFALMVSLSTLFPSFIIAIISSYFVPKIYHSSDKNYIYQETRRLIYFASALFTATFIFIFLFHSIIVNMVSTNYYASYSYLLPIIFVIVAIYHLSMIETYHIFHAKHTQKLLFANILPGIVAAISCLFLIPLYGLHGAIISYGVTYSIHVLLVYLVSIKLKYFSDRKNGN